MIMCPIDGCPFGISGNNLEKKGPTILDKSLIPPALSAILIKPIKRLKIPTSLRQISTATQQVSTIPSSFSGLLGSAAFPITIQLNICVSPKKKHRIPATKTATMINADQILLKAI
jgi:hypothetical protein